MNRAHAEVALAHQAALAIVKCWRPESLASNGAAERLVGLVGPGMTRDKAERIVTVERGLR